MKFIKMLYFIKRTCPIRVEFDMSSTYLESIVLNFGYNKYFKNTVDDYGDEGQTFERFGE